MPTARSIGGRLPSSSTEYASSLQAEATHLADPHEVLAVEPEQLRIAADEDTAAARRFADHGPSAEEALGTEGHFVSNHRAKTDKAAFADHRVAAHDALGSKPAMVIDAGVVSDHNTAP